MPHSLPLFDAPVLLDVKPPKLRPHQERAIINLRAQILMGRKRILAVGPVAVGKMVLVAAITRLSSDPMLFVCNRRELIDQCAKELREVGLSNFGVIRGNDERYDPSAAVQLASIQTLARRDKPFLSAKRVLIFLDEAHIAASDSYVDHVFQAYPNAIIIGLTATPCRLDGRPLGGNLFEVLVQIATYEELFKRPNWIARPDVYAAPLRPDVSQVRMSGSDFDDEALDAVVRTSELEGQIVEHWQRLAHLHPVLTKEGVRIPQQFVEGERRRTLGFFVSVAHSQSVAARFEKAGVRVAHLDGTTKDVTRDNIWNDLRSGALEVVCNCNVGIAGIDVPAIKCIVHARPTWSVTLWRQSTGREMRAWRSSEASPWMTPILLDHGGNMDRLGCPFEDVHWSLTERPRRLSGRLPMRLCKTCFAYNEPGRVVCLFCGAEFPKAEDRPLPAETSAELLLRQSEPEELKRAFFSRQVTMAKTHGFKPGYASAMYKEQYGHWPPEEWGQKVKADFAHDGAWQASLERRLARKKAREERDRIEETEMRKASLTERDKQVLIVYATRGKDERIQPGWWPMPKRVLESFCKLGWLVASGESWEITPAGMAVYDEMCKPLTAEEEAMSQTTRAMNESDEETFGDWWEGQQ